MNTRKRNRTIFYICMVALPILQFLIFYVYKNLSMFVYAFQKEEIKNNIPTVAFAGFENFLIGFKILARSGGSIKNSLLLLLFNGVGGLLIAILFAFYIYKNHRFGKFFNFMLFLPNILSTAVFGFIFLNITDVKVLGSIFGLSESLLKGDTALITIVFFNVIVGFGVHTLMFLGAMNNINESVVESAQLDGVNRFKELIYITIPLIYPTLVSFLVINFSGIFTNQMNLYTFFGMNSIVTTIGYDLYVNTLRASNATGAKVYDMYQLSAYSIILTAIVFTITVTVRKVLNKFGPSDL